MYLEVDLKAGFESSGIKADVFRVLPLKYLLTAKVTSTLIIRDFYIPRRHRTNDGREV